MKKLVKDKFEKRSTEFLIITVLVVIGAVGVTASSDSNILDAGAGSSDGLVAEYRFDTGAGETAYDTSGGNKDGTINGATWTNGVKGKSLKFDGNDDYANSGDLDYISNGVNGEYTTSVWIKFDTIKQSFFFGDEQSGNGGVMMQTDSSGYLQTYYGGYHTSSYQVQPDIWYHVSQIQNTSGIFLQVNGDYTEKLTSSNHDETSYNTQIGRFGSNGRYHNGKIDEINLYSKALNHSQIKSLYNSGSWRIGTTTEEKDPDKVAEFSFQHQNSSHVLDTSGYNNHGEKMNGVSQEGAVNCKVGRCYSFDGNDDYISSGYSEEPSDITIMAWAKPLSAEDNDAVVGRIDDSGDNEDCYLGIRGSTWEFTCQMNPGGSDDWRETSSGVSPSIGEWVHLTGRYDSAREKLAIFLDGKLMSEVDAPSPTHPTNNAKFQIGRWEYNDLSHGMFDGKIDQVKIFNQSLSNKEVWNIYTNGRDRESGMGGPVGRWEMDNMRRFDNGYFQAPGSTGDKYVESGFEPDLIKFTVTETNENFDTETEYNGEENGEGHGFADCTESPCVERAVTHGSGSSSMNGQATSGSDSHSVYQVVTPNDGNGINGYISGSVSNTNSTGFTLNFDSVQQQQYVTYKAYKFEKGAEVDVDHFNTSTSTGLQTVSTGFRPDFVNMKANPRLETVNDEIQDGSDHGITHGWGADTSEGIEQQTMSVSSYSNNRDDHVFSAHDDKALDILHAENKGGITGYTTASLESFSSDGFDLDYSNVETPSQTVIYAAVQSEAEPELGWTKTPSSEGTSHIDTSTPLDAVSFTASNTIPEMNNRGYSGGNNGDNHWGWMYGSGTDRKEQSIGHATHSDSTNGHAAGSSSQEGIKLLYADLNGNILDSDTARISNLGPTGISLNWTDAASSSISNVKYDNVVMSYHGFEGLNTADKPFADRSGGNSGDNYGAKPVDTERGEALEFDGDDDYVEVSDSSYLDDSLSNGFAVASWINIDMPDSGTGSTHEIIGKDTDYSLFLGSGGNLRFDNDADGGFETDIGSLSGWSHVTVVVQSDGSSSIFLNGEEIATGSFPVGSMGSSNNMYIGAREWGSNRYFNGKIDDVRIYPYALDQEQVKQVMNSGAVSVG